MNRIFALCAAAAVVASVSICCSRPNREQATAVNRATPLTSDELSHIQISGFTFDDRYPVDTKTNILPAHVSLWVGNHSKLELASVSVTFLLYDGNRNVLFRAPLTFSSFVDEDIAYHGNALTNYSGTLSATVRVPLDKFHRVAAYWFTLDGASGFHGPQDLHVPSHWFSEICNASTAKVKGLTEKDPSLVKVVDSNNGFTGLDFVALNDDPELFAAFVAKGAVIDAKTITGTQPIHFAAIQGPKVMQALLKAGANPDAKTTTNFTPLMFTGWKDNDVAFDLLLAKGVDVNESSNYGQHVASVAAYHDSVKVMKKIIARGGQLHYFDKQHDGPLSYAAMYDFVDIVDLLLAAGVKVNECDESGVTALHEAATNGKVNAIKELLKKGANPNLRDKLGHTPLDNAIHFRNPEAAELLAKVTTVRTEPAQPSQGAT